MFGEVEGENVGEGLGVGFEDAADGFGEGGVGEGAAEGAVEDLAAGLGESRAGFHIFPEFEVEAFKGFGVLDVFGSGNAADGGALT